MSHKGINRVDIIEYNKENPTCPYINLGNPIIWDSNNPEEFRITTIFDFVYMIIQDYVFVYNKNTQVNYDIEFGLGGVVFTLTALGLRSGTQRIMEIDYSSRDLLKRSTQRLIDYVERLLKVSFVIPRRCKINKEDVDKFGKYVTGVINKR